MNPQKRSRVVRRLSGACLTTILAALAGCSGPEIDSFSPAESDIQAGQIREAIRSIDQFYAPPRTPERVAHSLAIALSSINDRSRDEIQWRAVRACAWLAEHLPKKKDREDAAMQGVSIGRDAVRRGSERVEAPYFYAVALGRLSELYSTYDYVKLMRRLAEQSIELDPRFDHAGPHRFLGLLFLRTEANPVFSIGTLDDALLHLKTAVDLAPAYGANQLAYGEALVEDDRYSDAHGHLSAALRSAAPPGEEKAHAEWVARAKELLAEISG